MQFRFFIPLLLGVFGLAVFGLWFWLFPDAGLSGFQFSVWAVLSFGTAVIGFGYSFFLIGQPSVLARLIVTLGLLLCLVVGSMSGLMILFLLFAGDRY